jgi:hypothetical protein
VPEPNVAYIVLMEDEIIHTQTRPFCLRVVDPTCPCREDQELIQEVSDAVSEGLLTPEEATRFVRGEML